MTRPRQSLLWGVAALILAVAIGTGMLALMLVQEDRENQADGTEQVSAILVITLINARYAGSGELGYELYLNGNLSANGTIAVADSAVIERTLTWTGSELLVLIQVVVADSDSQPGDRWVVVTPGETERVNIVLSA